MRQLTPDEAFASRVRDVRETAHLTRAELAERLREVVGYDGLSEQAIGAIERKARRVSLSDALALAAALGVAPINLMVPFEKPEPVFPPRIEGRPADEPVFESDAQIVVGEKLLPLIPIEARRWIKGTQLPLWGALHGGLGDFDRYYVSEVRPARRWLLDYAIREHRAGKRDFERLSRMSLKLSEDMEPRFVAKGDAGRLVGLPAGLWTLLVQGENDNEEES